MNEGIIEFLKSIAAVVPEDFNTEPLSDEYESAFSILADELYSSAPQLYAPQPNLNVTYAKKDLKKTLSMSDSNLSFEKPQEFPIHRR